MNEKVEQLIAQIHASDYTHVEISQESGIERSWVSRFARGEIANPGIQHFDALRATMTRLSRRKR